MESFEASLAKATERGSNKGVAGAVVAVVDKTGKFIYRHVQGSNGVSEQAPPLQFDQTYFVASCTKLIASIAALQCVERGLIALDDPLDKHLPEFTSQQIIKTKDDGSFTLHDAKNPVTLRHLLTHSSGAAYTQFIPSLVAWRKSQGHKPEFVMGEDVAEKYPEPRLFEAGEGWMYGASLDWAGLLVSRLTGQSLGTYVEQNIATPLNITSFTWNPASKPQVKEKLMTMSVRKEDGTLVDSTEPIASLESENGGAGMYSNIEDYTRVLVDLLQDNPKTLKKETVEMIFSPQFANGGPEQQAMIPVGDMTWATHTGRIAKGVTPNYSLAGYFVTEDVERADFLIPKGTLTWSGLPNLQWAVNRERGIGYMFCTQILPWNDDVSQSLSAEFCTAVWRNLVK
ncbi:unnamed protein product [Periconia digitata]|uniref:Beta-lactamase-related domain-containing protein n=1 Tax=Periconia digitata TaxID=1303443 RepID=A0A9W4U785_9PLEO|nr:unnamed protein product [Periconia digitata]